MTAWPEKPMPVPRVVNGPGFFFSNKRNAGFFLVDVDDEDGGHCVAIHDIPDELFLRDLWDLDLSRAETIYTLSNRANPDGTIPLEIVEPPDHPETIEDFVFRYGMVGWGGMHDLPDWYGFYGVKKKIRALRRREYSGNPGDLDETKPFGGELVVHLEEFRLHARALRDMTRIWLCQSGLMSFETLQESWELPLPPPKSPSEAMYLLIVILNEGLKPFHAHLGLFHLDHEGKPMELSEWGQQLGHRPWGAPLIGTYNVLCLQLFNHVVEGIVPLRCANEKCERFFVRQQGRSESRDGRHRVEGVRPIYCSAHCAQAHHARMLRQDRARALRLSQSGLSAEQIAVQVDRQVATIGRWLAQPKRIRGKGGKSK